MSPDTVVALITLSGVILTAVVLLIGTIATVWLSGRKDRREQRQIEAARHEENTGRLNQMAADIAAVKDELPDGGLGTWISTVRANSESIERHGQAMSRLADSMDALDKRVVGAERAIAVLQAGGTA